MQKAQDFNMASDKRWVNIMGGLNVARRDLKTLAANPNRPDHKGPLFVRDTAKTGSEEAAVFADVMIGMFLGAHFGMAANLHTGIQHLNVMSTIEVYDTYQRDTANDRTYGESNRGIELGTKGAITGGFNMNTTHRPVRTEGDAVAWEAYMRDLPKRRVIEQSIGALNREADQREKVMLRQHRQLAFGA